MSVAVHHSLKSRITLAIGLAFALLFLALAMRDTELSAITASLQQANYLYGLAAAVALMLQFWFKAWRWGLFLRPFVDATTARVYPATVVGYLANLVFPVYIGEFARVYILKQQLGVRYTPVLATVILERVFDFLSVLLIVGVVLILEPKAPVELDMVGKVAGGASLLLILMLAAFLRWTDPLIKLTLRVSRFLPEESRRKIAEQIELGATGLQSIRDAKRLPVIVIASLLQWAAMGACVYMGMLGTGIDAPLSAGFVVLALTVMGVTLPSSPGYFGTIQLCFTLGLAPFGVAPSDAFAASLLFHLSIYVTGWLAGLFYLRRSGFTLGALRQRSMESGADDAAEQ